MSACSSFTEHVWKPGECKNCFQPKGQHQLAALGRGNSVQPPPPPPPPPPYRANHAKVTSNQRPRATTGFRPPVAKKPTIAVKPTMMAVEGAVCHPPQGQARAPLPPTRNQNQAQISVCNDDRANNNTEADQGVTSNNNHVGSSGLTEVLKEIAGLGSPPASTPTPEGTSRETFLCRINQCYRRSLERKPSASCLSGGRNEGGEAKRGGRHVAMSGEEGAVIGRDGGRFCYPEFSSGEESWEEEGEVEKGERESWEESDEELLAMEIRMRGQPRFANLQGGSLSPAPGRPGGREKWNTVPLRQKSLQRVCAVDYDDSYDEILNGCDVVGDGDVPAISPSPDLSMAESFSCPPSSSSSSSGGLFCNGEVVTEKAKEGEPEMLTQLAIQDNGMAQAKPYRVVSLEQPVCKPYTVVDVSAAMAGEGLAQPSIRLKKTTATRYQEVWTSSTSPRQKMAKTEVTEAPRRSCHKSAPTSPTAGLSSHTVPVRSPNLSEIKFNSYNNAGMPPFPIIIHDEPEYAHSCKSADKVPILINPSAYDNLAIYRSFVGAGGVFPPPPEKEKRQTGSIISHTYEEIETPAKGQRKEETVSEVAQEVGGCPRESANRVLSQIVASIQPPRSPPETVTPEPASIEEQRPSETHPDPQPPPGSLGRPKTLFPLQSEVVGTLSFSKPSPISSTDVSPTVSATSEPLPPFPPPRSTSSPYHASMLQKHFVTRSKPAGTNRPSPTECTTQPRRQSDGKPRRWISFKSFFRRKKEGSAQGDERGEEGKLVGLDGTVIHMLPPPPVQRHHWFSESRVEPGEKPSIVFVCRPEEDKAASSPQDSVGTDNRSNSTLDDTPAKEPLPASPVALPSPDELIVTSTVVQSAAGAEMQPTEEPGTASDCSSDCSPGGATYSNLGQSRANMIPYKQPRQTRGGSPPQDMEPHPTPPPLPKKNLAPRQPTPERTPRPPMRLANPTYDKERSWEAGGSESGDSLERAKGCGGRIAELQAEALKRFYARCEDVFMAGQREPLSFGLESWPDFRLTSPTPCCQAGDAVYYQASYARDPGNTYAVKICRSKSKQAQREYYHCLAVRQGLSEHFNIQQDCGHFLAEVPARLLPWEDPTVSEEEDEEQEEDGVSASAESKMDTDVPQKQPLSNNQGSLGKRRSRVVVITREPPQHTLADFVREGEEQHRREPEAYERQVCLLLLQLCGALEHLKAQGITHCDLRLDNLLLSSCRAGETGCSCSRGSTRDEQNESGKQMGAKEQRAISMCPGRLLLTNFSQAKLKNQSAWRPQGLGDPTRLAPEIVGATQYRRSDEFQAGILIYELLHLPNPFLDGGLKEREYAPRDLPVVPRRSPYSRGLGRLAGLLLQHSPSDRLQVGQAKSALRCLIWGPREDVLQGPGALHTWLEVKRTLLLIRLAERALEKDGGVTLEDWLCCQYLAFGTAQGLAQTLRLLEQH